MCHLKNNEIDELVNKMTGYMAAQKRDCNGGMTEVSDVHIRFEKISLNMTSFGT